MVLTITELADELAEKYGQALGTEVLGFPTSWCTTREEYDRLIVHLKAKGIRP